MGKIFLTNSEFGKPDTLQENKSLNNIRKNMAATSLVTSFYNVLNNNTFQLPHERAQSRVPDAGLSDR